MFEITKEIIGYLPQNMMWIYIVFILVFFFLIVGIIFKLLGGDF